MTRSGRAAHPTGADLQPTSRWLRALSPHLGSRDVARVIYGTIIGLALVVALEAHPPQTREVIGAIVATAIAVGFAELYSDVIGAKARHRRAVRGRRLGTIAQEAGAVTFGAAFPAVYFILAATGAIELDLAFRLAKWSGLALIAAYGYVAGRLAGDTRLHSAGQAVAVVAIGALIIGAKALLH